MPCIFTEDIIAGRKNFYSSIGDVFKVANRGRNDIEHGMGPWVENKVAPRFELGNGSFAGFCLTTWPCHLKIEISKIMLFEVNEVNCKSLIGCN